MATRRDRIKAAVSKEMQERDLPGKEAHGEPTEGLHKAYGRPTLYPVRVRIPETDIDVLEQIAEQEGTTTSALIRKAIKELIRKQGAGLR